MRNRRSRSLLVVALSLCAGVASAADACLPTVRDGWLRWSPGGMGAAYARIDNRCPAAVDVVAASSPAFADVSLHATRVDQGVSRMRALPALSLPANGTVSLEPGAAHLMLMAPTRVLQPGDQVTIAFRLHDGRTITGRFVLRPLTQAP